MDHETFRAHISPIVQRWNEGLRQARLSGNEDEVNRHKGFRTDLHTYLKSWEFLSQIVNFEDTTMRKRAILAAYLARNLHLGLDEVIDVSSVDIIGVAVTPKSVAEDLGIAFTEAVDEANAILTAAGIPASNKAVRGFVMQVWGTLAPNEDVAKMGAENAVSQLEHAPGFEKAVVGALTEVMNTSREIQELFLGDDVSLKALNKVLAHQAHRAVSQQLGTRKMQVVKAGGAPPTPPAFPFRPGVYTTRVASPRRTLLTVNSNLTSTPSRSSTPCGIKTENLSTS